MARISSYQRDLEVQDQDAWIGTEASNRLTRNFTAEAVAEYLNIKGKISISAQMVFKFVATLPTTGTFTGVADGTPFANITSLDLAIKDSSGQDVVEFLDYLVGNQILLSEQNAISNFGHYKILTYSTPGSFADSYTLTLQYLGGNGNMVNANHYDIAAFSLPGSSGVTGEFPFNASTNPFTITINHLGLQGDYPSVTIVTTGNRVIFGEVNYTSTTQLTVTFSKAFSGTVYTN